MKALFTALMALALMVACGPTNSNETQEDASDGILPGAGPTGAVVEAIKADEEEPQPEVESPKEEGLKIAGNPMQTYLDDPDILPVAKEYFTGRFEVSDEPKTHSMVNVLNTCGEAHRPFYLAVFNKIVGDADEQLGDALGAPAREFVQKDPATFSQFAVSSSAEYSGTQNKWVELVGFEFVLEDDPQAALTAYKKRLEAVCDSCSEKQKAALNAFVMQLESYVKENG